MRQMKDSGIEWIGEIPESWDVERLKYHIDFNPPTDIPSYDDEQQVSFLPMDCLRRGTHTIQIADYGKVKKGYVVFQNGDILMAKVTPCLENGNIAIARDLIDNVGFGSTEINVIRCSGIHRKYLFYTLQCKTYIERAVADMYGVAGLKRLNPSFIPNMKHPIPSLDEQSHIADYLDKKCAEIDAIIAAKEKTNELLKERRQSIIYEAVTKGLDPTVPMKDSGVEWIGMIPESWEIERLKYHIEFNPTTDIPEYEDDRQVSFVPMDCLRRGTHTFQIADYEKVKKGYVVFKDGDILMAKVTPCLENGNIAIACNLIDGIGFGSTEINVIRCATINREYLFYMLQCKTYIERAVADMYGVAGLKRLNPSFIPNTKYPIPSKAEQEEIAEHLRFMCNKFDALISSNNSTIEKLKEYRQSVIYEAVTGKVEI